MEKVISTTENILNEAVNHCSCNSSYYDRLLDTFDNMLEEFNNEEDR